MRAGEWAAAARLVRGEPFEHLYATELELQHWQDRIRASWRATLPALMEGLELEQRWSDLRRIAAIHLRYAPDDSIGQRYLAEAEGAVRRDATDPIGASRSPSSPSVGTFVGRRKELAQLRTAWTTALDTGNTRIVVVAGPRGMGKTAVCDRFLRLAAVRGARVLSARGYRTERNLPLGVVSQFLREPAVLESIQRLAEPWRSILFRAFPSLADEQLLADNLKDVHEAEGRLRLFEALRAALALPTTQLGTVVFVDDVQWADPASVSFLQWLGHREQADDGCRLVLLSCSSDHLVDLSTDIPDLLEIKLDGLNSEDARELWSRLGSPTVSARDVGIDFDELVEMTGGNPLMLQSVAIHNHDLHHDLDVPTPAELVRPKLARLHPEARLTLAALSVLGGQADLALLQRVCALDEGKMLLPLTQLENANFVSSTGSDIFLLSSLAGDVALSDTPPLVNKLLHGRAGRALRDQGSASPAVIAVQLDVGGQTDESFGAALEAANASGKLFAHREQEFFLKLALSHSSSKEVGLEVRHQLAELYLKLGRYRDARGICLEAWDSSSGRISDLKTQAYVLSGVLAEGSELPRHVREAVSLSKRLMSAGEMEVAATLLFRVCKTAHDAGMITDLQEITSEMTSLAERIDNSDLATQLTTIAAAATSLSGSVSEGVKILSRAGTDPRTPEANVQLLATKALLKSQSGDLRGAETACLEALEIVERLGLFGVGFRILNNLGACYIEMGRSNEARQALDRALQRIDLQFWGGDPLIVYDNLAILEFEESEFAESLRVADRTLKANHDLSSRRSWFTMEAIKGLNCLALGRLAEASESRRNLELGLSEFEYWLSDVSYVEIFLARMLRLSGSNAKAADRLRRACAEYAERDFFCRTRMEVELLSFPDAATDTARLGRLHELSRELREAGAVPLQERVEGIITRIEAGRN